MFSDEEVESPRPRYTGKKSARAEPVTLSQRVRRLRLALRIFVILLVAAGCAAVLAWQVITIVFVAMGTLAVPGKLDIFGYFSLYALCGLRAILALFTFCMELDLKYVVPYFLGFNWFIGKGLLQFFLGIMTMSQSIVFRTDIAWLDWIQLTIGIYMSCVGILHIVMGATCLDRILLLRIR